MVEVIHPEMTASDLAAQMRQELARRAGNPPAAAGGRTDGPATSLTWDQIAAELQRAEQHAYMGRSVPKLRRLRGLRRRLARFVARCVLYLAQVFTKAQREYNVATVNAVRDLCNAVRDLEAANREGLRHLEAAHKDQFHDVEVALGKQELVLREQRADVQQLESILQEQEGLLRRLEETLRQQEAERQEQGEAFEGQREALEGQRLALDGQRLALEEHGATLREQTAALQDHGATLTRHEEALGGHQALSQKLQDQGARLDSIGQTLAQVKTTTLVQEARLRCVLEEARRRLNGPLPPERLEVLAREADHSLDALYVAFEDQFRGTREDIKARLRVYLPRLREAAGGAPVLDIGCGRGEWLEVMRDEGIPARGVDLNRVMVGECRQRGFEVHEGDALAYLRGLPDTCLGAVTGFHLIEHLPWGVLLNLLDETVRVLRPGGVAIFETPNPENLVVGACNFWADPTHRKPLYPPLIQFLAEQRGLVDVEVWRLNQHCWGPIPLESLPADHALAGRLNPLIEVARRHFYGAPDFAVVGRKVQ